MSALVSKTLIRDARKHLKANMAESATILRTGIEVPAIVVVQRWAVPLRGALSSRARVRKWNILMPASAPALTPDPVWAATGVQLGDRISVPGHGVFMVLEVTDPNTYNAATSVWCITTNAKVRFSRPQVGAVPTDTIDAFIQRVSDEERSWGVQYDWEVWWDSSVVFADPTTPGGQLISKGDQMHWFRTPNPFPKGGHATIDKPRYVYGENQAAMVTAYFKEEL